MSFADLETLSLPDLIAREAARPGFWLFQHIPKTAGSSLSGELATRAKPYRNLFADYKRTDIPPNQQMPMVVRDFAAEMAERPHASASGHLLWPQVQELCAAHPGTRVVTFLRDPVERVISDYRYQRTPMHPPHQAFMRQFPTLEAYVESPLSQNKIAVFLGGRPRNPDIGALVQTLRHGYAFVGLLELYPLSLATFFAMMGRPGVTPGEPRRKTPDIAQTEVSVTPGLRDRIRQLNAADQALYDHAWRILSRHA